MKRTLLFVVLSLPVIAVAQQQQFHFFVPVPHGNQLPRGSAAASTGAVGLTLGEKRRLGFTLAPVAPGSTPEGKLVVTEVAPGSPAERGGIRTGDVITAVDGKPATNWSKAEIYDALPKRPGESVKIAYTRQGQNSEVTLTAEPRIKVFPEAAMEANSPPAVMQFLFGDHWAITAGLYQRPESESSALLFVQVASRPDSPVMNIDMTKFFVLDGQGQQLTEITGEQAKYSWQLWLAQNLRAGSYIPPPPPPAQRSYTITGSEHGTYTIQDLGGGMGTISGSSTGSYTVTPGPDYAALGYSLGLALRQWADRRHDKKLLEEAQKQIQLIDQSAFKAQSPLLPGELRQGEILYWSGSTRTVYPPFKVIMFFTEPGTNKEETVTFEFQ